jgi:hypothetical protein
MKAVLAEAMSVSWPVFVIYFCGVYQIGIDIENI